MIHGGMDRKFLFSNQDVLLIMNLIKVSWIERIIFAISKGRAIGGGDVKLMFACGIFLGAANSVLALIVGCAVGSVVHLIRMRVSGAGKVLAMGPYLAIGILTAALFGDMIIPWYMSLFQA